MPSTYMKGGFQEVPFLFYPLQECVRVRVHMSVCVHVCMRVCVHGICVYSVYVYI